MIHDSALHPCHADMIHGVQCDASNGRNQARWYMSDKYKQKVGPGEYFRDHHPTVGRISIHLSPRVPRRTACCVVIVTELTSEILVFQSSGRAANASHLSPDGDSATMSGSIRGEDQSLSRESNLLGTRTQDAGPVWHYPSSSCSRVGYLRSALSSRNFIHLLRNGLPLDTVSESPITHRCLFGRVIATVGKVRSL